MESSQLDSPGSNHLSPCSLCGRRFATDRLEKHIVICQKLKDKKRKTFDSTKQRAENLDKINNCDIQLKPTQPEAQPPAKAKRTQTKAAAAAPPPPPPTVSKTSNWREQHQEFVRTIRAARGEQVEPKVEQLDSEGRKVVPAGFVECSSCGRRFSERAAERHLPWCADKAKAAAQTREEDDRRLEALERQKARTKYKPGQKLETKTSRAPSSTSIASKASTGSLRTPSMTRKYTRNISRSTDNLQAPSGAGKIPNHAHGIPKSSKTMTKSTLDLTSPASRSRTPSTMQRNGNLNRTIVIRKGDSSQAAGGKTYARSNAAAISSIKTVTAKINTGLKSPTKSTMISNTKKSAPVMKFKERFPNHQQRISKIDYDVLQRRDSNLYDDSPKTVPGVRTGGLSPPKANANETRPVISRSEADLNNIGSEIKLKIDRYINGLSDNEVLKQFGTGLSNLVHRKNGKASLSRQNSGASDDARGSTSESTDSGLGVIYGAAGKNVNGDFKRKEIVSPPMSVGELEQGQRGLSMMNGSLNDLHLITGRASDVERRGGRRYGSIDFAASDFESFNAHYHQQCKDDLLASSPLPDFSGKVGLQDDELGGIVPRFCHNCGTKYPNTMAKFCYECGSRRFGAEAVA